MIRAPEAHSKERKAPDEADLSTESYSSETESRVSCANEDAWRPGDLEAPPRQGPKASRGSDALEITVFQRTGRFSRTDRLLHSADFRRVGRVGRRCATRFFVVLLAPAPDVRDQAAPRLGITVSRRVGNAVVRNQIKRGVREWFRRNRRRLETNPDLVVIARSAASGLSIPQMGDVLNEMILDVGISQR